jgi:hypothetical protein
MGLKLDFSVTTNVTLTGAAGTIGAAVWAQNWATTPTPGLAFDEV